MKIYICKYHSVISSEFLSLLRSISLDYIRDLSQTFHFHHFPLYFFQGTTIIELDSPPSFALISVHLSQKFICIGLPNKSEKRMISELKEYKEHA